ncbi:MULTISPECIES: erythromycin resistance leader peptide [Bacillaceae]|nr:erythromycin resistance leader peptide [Cytobacillus oceanisediminis]MBY0154175.1 erythromycin resistance leader peptide [Cytobacillus firmus]QOK29674.1 erythromycin resistance leader peptide [Cytobacillus oceanisediminis]UJL48224.1 erythromycin resistance leader peptide [Virgibacillus sp. NKC19-16]
MTHAMRLRFPALNQ